MFSEIQNNDSNFAAKLFKVIKMNKVKFAIITLAMTATQSVWAGGLLTNTNQNVAFDRMLSRDAAIGIDGVYSNPAGVAFLNDGFHLSLNWQLVFQSRIIQNEYPLFARNQNDNTTTRTFRGTAFAPVLPSIQAAYNWKGFSFQAMFGITGGGGKCTFDNGLGSFEKIVAETAMGATALAGAIDKTMGRETFTSDKMFGKTGSYSYNSFMRGRQYYYSLSLGAAYKFNDNLSGYAGVRGVYAMSNYYGYVRDIKVGRIPLYTVLDPSRTNSSDIELNCDQTGVGFTPILGIDYKVGRWNFAAKYEFKTRMRLKNESVNSIPSIGNLPSNLAKQMIQAGMTVEQARSVLTAPAVAGSMKAIKDQFDSKLGEAIGEYEDGKKVAADIPAYLAVGVGYNPIDPLRVNVGFHYFFDKQATTHNHREDLLKRGTIECNAGVEYDASQRLTISAGWQNTSYGLTDKFMDDKSFVTSSNSVGCGVKVNISKKVKLNLAYFHTFYKHYKTETPAQLGPTTVNYKADFTRNNNVFGAGLDIDF